MKRQFRIISEETVCQTPKFTFKLLQAETDGKTQTFCRLERPVIVFVIPISPTGRTVILRQFRFPVGKEFWEFPAGHTEPGEDHPDSAMRELQEETSLQVSTVELAGQFFGMPSSSSSSYKVYIARVTDEALDNIQPPEDEDEITTVKVTSLATFADMVANQEIESGTSLAAFTFAQAHLARKEHGKSGPAP